MIRARVAAYAAAVALVIPAVAESARITVAVPDLEADPATIAFSGRDFGVEEGRLLQAVGPDPVELVIIDWQDQRVVAELAAEIPGMYVFALEPIVGEMARTEVAIGLGGMPGEPGAELRSVASCGPNVIPCNCPDGILLAEVPNQCEVTSDAGSCSNIGTGLNNGCCVCRAPLPVPIDLTPWVVEDYVGISGDPLSEWALAPDALSVEQLVNANPAVLYSDFDTAETVLKAIVGTRTTSDDDFFGFAIGYQPGNITNPDADYLLVDWKQQTQSFTFDCGGAVEASAGLAVSRVTGLPGGGEFWGHVNVDEPCSDLKSGFEELQRGFTLGSTGWADNQTYVFDFLFTESSLQVFVDGVLELDIFGDFNDGRFAFYTFSQANVVYAASIIDR